MQTYVSYVPYVVKNIDLVKNIEHS